MMNKQKQSFQEDQQIETGGSMINPLPECVIPLTELKTISHPQYAWQFLDGDTKLIANNEGIIILKEYKQCSKLERKYLNAKVYTTQLEEKAIKQDDKMNQSCLRSKIFSIKENVQTLKKNCTEIVIIGCKINIYALKKLVKIVSEHLISLKISRCEFFESDNEAIYSKVPSSNNKMLRELNFSYLVRSLSLPQIESIVLELKVIIGRSNLNEKLPIEQLQSQNDENNKIEYAQKYECHPDSHFIDFELTQKQKLEKKYKKFKNETELTQSIIKGDLSDNTKIEESIDQEIIKDINEHVLVFNKYIKSSFHKSSILIIKQDCLEDPIAYTMLQTVIFLKKDKNKSSSDKSKNHDGIKTVVFKEVGVISSQSLKKIIDLLFMISNLESIAFFESWPEDGSYKLLKDLVFRDSKSPSCFSERKKDLLLVLNRSSFNLQEYRREVWGQDAQAERENDLNVELNRYGFYILERQKLLEFTPYSEQFINNIMLNKQDKQSGISYQSPILELYQHQLKYSKIVQSEICKYKDDYVLLSFEAQSEQALCTFFEGNTIDQKVIEDQNEIFFRYFNQHNLNILEEAIYLLDSKVQQNIFQEKLKVLKSTHKVQYRNRVTRQAQIYQSFLIDQKWVRQIIIKDQTVMTKQSRYSTSKDMSSYPKLSSMKEITDAIEMQLSPKTNLMNQNRIKLIFSELNIKVQIIISNKGEKMYNNFCQVELNERLKDKDQETRIQDQATRIQDQISRIQYYETKEFLEEYEKMISYFKQIEDNYSLEIEYTFYNKKQLDTHIKLLETHKIKQLKWLSLTSTNKEILLEFEINPELVQKLSLNGFSGIKGDLFARYRFTTIKLENCNFDSNNEEFINILLDQIQGYYESNRRKVMLKLVTQNPNEIALSKDLVLRMCNHLGIDFQLKNLNVETIDYFVDLLIARQFKHEDHQQLHQMFSQTLSLENSLSFEILNPKINAELLPIEKKDCFEQLRDIFHQDTKLDIFIRVLNSVNPPNEFVFKQPNSEIHKTCNQQLSDCCKSRFRNKEDYSLNTASIRAEFENHFGDICYFKTSFFQKKSDHKEFQIRFYENLLTNECLLYDKSQIDEMQVLDISGTQISNTQQINFLNFLLENSSHLTELKFDFLQVAEDVDLKSLKIRNKQLRKLIIYNCDIILIESIFEISSLNYINVQQRNSIENMNTSKYSNFIRQLIERNSHSLTKLFINVYDQSCCEAIQKCKNLKVLEICLQSTSEYEGSLFVFMSDSLKKLNIKLQESEIDQQLLIDLYNHSLQLKKLKTISILISKNYFKTYYRTILSGETERIQKWRIDTDLHIIQESSEPNSENGLSFKELVKKQTLNDNSQRISKKQPESKKNVEIKTFNKNKSDFYNYILLDQLFQKNQNTLKKLIISDGSLTNSTLKRVDFGKLPKTIKVLDFSGNKNLSSIDFLNPLLKNIQNYKIKYLLLSGTKVNYIDTLKFQPYIKVIVTQNYYNEERFFRIIQYLYNNVKDQHTALRILLELGLSSFNNQKLMLKQLFQQRRLASIKMLCNINNPMVISQFMNSLNNQMEDINQLFETISIDRCIKNTYLIQVYLATKRNQNYVLGYSKNRKSEYVAVQETQSIDDFLFAADILLKNNNVKGVYLPINLEIYYGILEKQNDNYNKYKQNIRKLLMQIDNQNNKQNRFYKADDKNNIKNDIQKKEQLGFESTQVKEIEKKEKIISEIKLIEYLSKLPPSEIVIKNTSVQFIKIWYVINSISPLTIKTVIDDFRENELYNSSIGNYLTSSLPRNHIMKNLLSSIPKKYRYDETVQLLAEHFEQKIVKKQHYFLLFLFPLYTFVCIFGVVFISSHFDAQCNEGISSYSYCVYAAYGLITLFVELSVFTQCLNYISHLIPSIELNPNASFITKLMNFLKQTIIDTPWINQWYIGNFFSFIQSQITRFDNFTNVGFLYSTYQCGSYTTFYVALSFMIIPFLFSLYQFFRLIIRPFKNILPTSSLDVVYAICSVIEFRAVSDVLDLVSPSNVITIKGRMFNAKIITFFIRMVFENIPLVIIQIYNIATKEMTSSLLLSLLLSIITFLILLIGVLTVTPSTLTQEDFNKLNQKKLKEQTVEKYEERLQVFEGEMQTLHILDYLKELRLQYKNKKEEGNISYELSNEHKSKFQLFNQFFDSPSKLHPNQ